MNKLKTVVTVAAVVLGAGTTIPSALAAPASSIPYHWLNASPNGTYKIDPAHTEVLFTIGHVGIVPFSGRFDTISGSYTFNNKAPGTDRVHITIPVASINTDFALRDKDLRSPMFFNASRYPHITFVSTRYQPTGPKIGNLFGRLTLHGVTHQIVFHVRQKGAGNVNYLPKPWGGYLSGFVATTTIKRSDYGMKAYLPEGLSNAVHIKVLVEGLRESK